MRKILMIPAGDILPRNKLSPKNTIPRLEKGFECWCTGKFSRIIVSGGIFNPHKVQTITAALLMKDWLAANHVEEDRIIVEDRSLDTYQNIFFSLLALHREKIENFQLHIVSHPTHLDRFELTCKGLPKRRLKHPIVRIEVDYPLSRSQQLAELVFKKVHQYDPLGKGRIVKYNRRRRSSAG